MIFFGSGVGGGGGGGVEREAISVKDMRSYVVIASNKFTIFVTIGQELFRGDMSRMA